MWSLWDTRTHGPAGAGGGGRRRPGLPGAGGPAGSGFAEIRIASTPGRHTSARRVAARPAHPRPRPPHGDGLTILEVLGRGGTMGVPVLVVTAETDPERRVRALELGADDLVTKPFNLLELGAVPNARCAPTTPAAADVLARSLAQERTELNEELELNHAMAVEMLVSALSLRSPQLGARARASALGAPAVGGRAPRRRRRAPRPGSHLPRDRRAHAGRRRPAALVDDDLAAARCAIASEMLLADRHVLAAAAAQFRAPATYFERQIQRLAHSSRRSATRSTQPHRATIRPRRRRGRGRRPQPPTRPDLAEAFLAVCVPATIPLD